MKKNEAWKTEETISILNEINLKNAEETLRLVNKKSDYLYMPIVIGSTILATLAVVKLFS